MSAISIHEFQHRYSSTVIGKPLSSGKIRPIFVHGVADDDVIAYNFIGSDGTRRFKYSTQELVLEHPPLGLINYENRCIWTGNTALRCPASAPTARPVDGRRPPLRAGRPRVWGRRPRVDRRSTRADAAPADARCRWSDVRPSRPPRAGGQRVCAWLRPRRNPAPSAP